ncbi:MAG: hypothetical protein IJS46_06145 [Kiritimatiellae bacterium]|nr:hypothetical protein [Kiritimatiellia bacterium]
MNSRSGGSRTPLGHGNTGGDAKGTPLTYPPTNPAGFRIAKIPSRRRCPAVKGARLYASLFLADIRQRSLTIASLFVPASDK